jgi:hypothetical protein
MADDVEVEACVRELVPVEIGVENPFGVVQRSGEHVA